jgi:hypothetical protein
MTRTPFDAFAKQLLEAFLTPFGTVELNPEVLSESRFIDVRFIPTAPPNPIPDALGLLGKIATTACLLEPFRQAPSFVEVRNCLLKLFLVQAEVVRRANREDERVLEAALPELWMLVPTASEQWLSHFAFVAKPEWLPGVYTLGNALKSNLLVINQLPATAETLWLRLLGRGVVQQQAIAEVLALAADDGRRARVLQLLVNWKISLDVLGALEPEEQGLMAQLSQAYLEWEQQTEARGIERGERSLVLRQLNRRVGAIPESVRLHIEALSITQLEALGEALLDFDSLVDLEAWLAAQR